MTPPTIGATTITASPTHTSSQLMFITNPMVEISAPMVAMIAPAHAAGVLP